MDMDDFDGLGDVTVASSFGSSTARIAKLEAQLALEAERQAVQEHRIPLEEEKQEGLFNGRRICL